MQVDIKTFKVSNQSAGTGSRKNFLTVPKVLFAELEENFTAIDYLVPADYINRHGVKLLHVSEN